MAPLLHISAIRDAAAGLANATLPTATVKNPDPSTVTGVTCEIRYRLDPQRLCEFEAYARIWVALIERHGGKHSGYFMPRPNPAETAVSFPGVGEEGATDVAVALFTFPDEATYMQYREKVRHDPDAMAANARFGMNPPFLSYERIFLTPLST